MTEVIWIVRETKNEFFGDKGIAPNYIIPKNEIHLDITHLQNARLWLCLSRERVRCVATITPLRIERFVEGYYQGDLMLTTDIGKSLRFASSFESAEPYEISAINFLVNGLHLMTTEDSKELMSRIVSRIHYKFTKPEVVLRARQAVQSLPRSLRAAINQIILNYSLDQVWAAGTGGKLPPIANFAAALLTEANWPLSDVDLKKLALLDPLGQLMGPETYGRDEQPRLSAPEVDTDFVEIDPSTVYAREFVASSELEYSLDESMSKTEAAERSHQAMLRDIAAYLKSQNLTPYQSTSVDLLLIDTLKVRVFEIKSATQSNILSQVSKGAFQLAYYLEALKSDRETLEGNLVLEKVPGFKSEELIANVLERMGLNLLIYDAATPWPNRLKGLI